MINQRGIIRAPEFVLPRTTVKSSRAVDYRRYDTITIEDVKLDITVFFKKLAVCTAVIVLGAGVGGITPLLTRALESWQYF